MSSLEPHRTDTATMASHASTVAADAPEVLAEQVAVMQRNLPSMVLGNTLIPLVMALGLDGAVSARVWGPWLALQWLHSAFNIYGWWHTRGRRFSVRSAPRRARIAVGVSIASGLLWASGVVWMWPEGRLDLQIFMLFLVGGVTGGASHSLAALPKAYYVFLGPCVAAVLLMCLVAGGSATHVVLAVTVLAYGLTSLHYAANLNRTLVQTLHQRLELAALAADLQQQKERAEQAGVAKNRFLAAASHDLRQPVHALSLFMGALRDQPLPPAAADLVRHAASTVDGLGGLFNALLDVSRLDAGMVQPAPRRFAIDALLQRVAEGEGTVAASKGLRLRLRLPREGTVPAVRTDPVLLERMLRNLVNNAVRYTERGGVLIALRGPNGAGSALRLQVWDTGIGIPAQRQAEVFDEFVQLHNPQRDSRQGLGLGLAIVRRTAELLGIEVVLRSVPGRGSVFTLTLPPGGAADVPAAVAVVATEPAAHSSAGLRGLWVLVIDDDADVSAAMQALLLGWGCEVLAASAVDELMPQLLTQARVPDLIISDFRLRGSEDGPAAVARLRGEFNEDIPALLITGDTGPERLREAQRSGLALLHKPVAPQALLSAMVQALRSPEESPLHEGPGTKVPRPA